MIKVLFKLFQIYNKMKHIAVFKACNTMIQKGLGKPPMSSNSLSLYSEVRMCATLVTGFNNLQEKKKALSYAESEGEIYVIKCAKAYENCV